MPSLDEVITELREILAKLQQLDLWPPMDAVRTITGLIRRVGEIATTPPEPKPSKVTDVADAWHLIGTRSQSAQRSFEEVDTKITASIWSGGSGNAFRTSTNNLAARTASIPTAAFVVERELRTLATAMTDARTRHGNAFAAVQKEASFSWSDLWPWELAQKLTRVVEGLISAVEDLIGAYEDASTAVKKAGREIVKAMDEIEFPEHLPEHGGSVIDLVNQWDDDEGPLRGSVLSRYDDAYEKLSDAEQKAVDAALATARSPEERAWILAGIASGLSGQALQNYLDRLRGMSPAELDRLDPTGHGYVQPDGTTCGSSSLVMSQMMNDPAYALWMETGYDPATGVTDPRTPEERFADEALKMHDRTNSYQDRDGDPQVPYPHAIGTAPWAVANEMSAGQGSGVPGTQYGATTVTPSNAGDSYDAVTRAIENGHTVPLYVGNGVAPAHIVLVTGAEGDNLTLYNPASGQEQTITRDDYVNGTLDMGSPSPPLDSFGDMNQPWFAILPE